jgi:hypothetical protein
MTQDDLFEAFARRTDPSTSHAAAKAVESDVARLEMIVFLAVKAAGSRGLIWDEAGEVTGLDKASISPRWKPLRKKKLIKALMNEEGEVIKRRGKSGKSQIVWVAA